MNRRNLGIAFAIFALICTAGCGGNGSSNGGGGGSNPNSSSSYAFYLSGVDFSGSFYAVAGSVAIDTTSGSVTGGEEDYNDAVEVSGGATATDQPITGGTLTINSTTGQGTLTLNTGNGNLGSHGTETLAVQFINAKHAQIIEFDGTATSSGSLDLQTLTDVPSGPPSGNFAVAMSGIDSDGGPAAFGGVLTISGTGLNGTVDVNDEGDVTLAGSITKATISSPDSFGRGQITNTGLVTTFVYYVVSPKCIRLIDIDSTDSLVGSAFSQGSTAFTDASLGTSTFLLQGNFSGDLYDSAGMFTTSANNNTLPANFGGIADADVEGAPASGASISGTYSMSSTTNGYGSMTFTTAIQDVSALGIYLTDPNLNLNDPNNTSSGLGGGVVLDLDSELAGGIGVLTPQTDTTTGSFSGNYGFGGQEFNDFLAETEDTDAEFDFVGEGTVAGLALNGTGVISDPFGSLGNNTTDSNISFTGTATADAGHPGHYTLPLDISALGGNASVAIYQASGNQLFWIEGDESSLFGGSLQQQSGTPTPLSAARAKSQVQLK